jgi:hypothetical protein
MFWAVTIVGIWVGSSLLALLLVVLKVVLSGKRVRGSKGRLDLTWVHTGIV